ncbi:DUF4333 domain-containing protein [Thermoleophilia bacterium SCSIO 60948]|nr:DUF4333 domain-containing protein [Thermoleophilia bacterium SCSIO 60948]
MKLDPRRRGARTLACIAVASTLGLAACGSIDQDELQDSLAEQLAPQGGVEPEDISVDCPSDEENEEGNTFECTLTAPNGDELPVRVEITDSEGGYEAEVLQPEGG